MAPGFAEVYLKDGVSGHLHKRAVLKVMETVDARNDLFVVVAHAPALPSRIQPLGDLHERPCFP